MAISSAQKKNKPVQNDGQQQTADDGSPDGVKRIFHAILSQAD
jgi:hypothetical protein